MADNHHVMDEETSRSFSRMAYGHEMWIEGVKRENGTVSAYGLYGHKLVPDKPMPTDYANVILYDDDGRAPNPEREIVNKPRGWRFTFEDKGADVYTLYIDSNSVWVTNNEGWHRGSKRDYENVKTSAAYSMVAKRIISRDGKNPGSVMHANLEIVPDKATYKTGETAVFKVFYDGKPMPGLKMVVYCSHWQDLQFVKTDAEGILKVPVEQAGSIAVIAKYTDTDKAVSEEFDETSYTTSLVVDAE